MRKLLPLLFLLPALGGCARIGSILPGRSSGSGFDMQELGVSAPVFGEIIRAAAACGVPMSLTAQDRGARIEGAALQGFQRQGGEAMRNQYLASVQPPNLGPRDRSGYCGGKRVDIERADTFLAGAEGEAMARRADAAARSLVR